MSRQYSLRSNEGLEVVNILMTYTHAFGVPLYLHQIPTEQKTGFHALLDSKQKPTLACSSEEIGAVEPQIG